MKLKCLSEPRGYFKFEIEEKWFVIKLEQESLLRKEKLFVTDEKKFEKVRAISAGVL